MDDDPDIRFVVESALGVEADIELLAYASGAVAIVARIQEIDRRLALFIAASESYAGL